jgi:hypothetical protein
VLLELLELEALEALPVLEVFGVRLGLTGSLALGVHKVLLALGVLLVQPVHKV